MSISEILSQLTLDKFFGGIEQVKVNLHFSHVAPELKHRVIRNIGISGTICLDES